MAAGPRRLDGPPSAGLTRGARRADSGSVAARTPGAAVAGPPSAGRSPKTPQTDPQRVSADPDRCRRIFYRPIGQPDRRITAAGGGRLFPGGPVV